MEESSKSSDLEVFMKKLILGFCLVTSATAFANDCEVVSVTKIKGTATGLRPQVEEILTSKGHKVTAGGYLYEKANVIQEDLLKEGTVIVVTSGELSDKEDTVCVRSGKTLSCSFEYSLMRVGPNKMVSENIKSRIALTRTIGLFSSEKDITEKFVKKALSEVKSYIPYCQ